MALLDACWFVAGSSGTDDFADGTALTGYRNLSGASAVNAAVYTYRAKHPTDDSIWEIGYGAYSSGGGTLARTTIVASSTGSKINFAVAPVVALLPRAGDFGDAAFKNTGTGSGDVAAGDDSRITGARQQGRETLIIPAAAWAPTVTNGAGRSFAETTTNDLITESLDFDTTTQEFATVRLKMPKRYNGGTFAYRVTCLLPGASSTQTVDFALSAAFIRNDDASDAALGTAVVVTDTFIATGDIHIGPESSAVTANGTYAAGCDLVLKLQRNVSTDNAAGDAQMLAVEIFWTSNAANDA